MDKSARKRPGKDEEGVSRDLRSSAAPLLGEDEMIYRALQIAALRADRCVQQGLLTQDAAAAIRHVMESVDGRISAAEYLEQASHIVHTHSLPRQLTLTGVIDEIRALMELGKLSTDGDEQQLFRLVSGLSGIAHSDMFLKGLSFFKGRMLWATLRLLRDPDDGRRDEWLDEISKCADTFQQGVQTYLKRGTLAKAEADLMEALAKERVRRG